MRWLRAEPTSIWFAGGFLILLIGFAVGPRVPFDQQIRHCIVNVDLPGPFGIGLNCDSPEFLLLATRPSALFEPNNTRQSRPGLVLAAWLVSTPLRPIASLVTAVAGRPSRPDIAPQRIDGALARDGPAYAAYVVLNIVFLLIAFRFLRAIVAAEDSSSAVNIAIVVAAGLVLVANDVVKAFVWSPHTQMFNVMVPVVGVHLALRCWRGAWPDWRFALGWGLVCGLGIAAYPLFAVLVACVVLPTALRSMRCGAGPRRSVVAAMAVFVVVAAAPMLGWYLLVRLATGGFYHHEIALGQLTWMAAAWHSGSGVLLLTLLRHGGNLVSEAAAQAMPLAALLVLLLIAAAADPRPARHAFHAALPVIGAALLVCLLVLVFYASVGYTPARLAFALLPALLVAVGAYAAALVRGVPPSRQRGLAAGFVLVAVGQMVFAVVKDGPWS